MTDEPRHNGFFLSAMAGGEEERLDADVMLARDESQAEEEEEEEEEEAASTKGIYEGSGMNSFGGRRKRGWGVPIGCA